jgi:hypothetical protein
MTASVVWCSEFLATDPEVRFRFPALPDFLRSSGPESSSELYRPRDSRLSAKLVPTFCGCKVPRGQRDGSLRPYSRFSRPGPLLFLSSSSSIVLTRLMDPVPDPLLLIKSGSAGNRSRDLFPSGVKRPGYEAD